MTEYRLDKATDTWLRYDEKRDVWLSTEETQNTNVVRPATVATLMQPINGLAEQNMFNDDVLTFSAQGQHTDDSVTISKGILIQSLPIFGLSFPLGFAIVALVWILGLVDFGFLAFVITAILLSVGFSLIIYSKTSERIYKHSHYGIERKKVESMTAIKQQELHYTYSLKKTALDAYLKRLETNDE